ncbi:MAG: hypothetical protein PHT03_08580 [Bacilli bacterium]|nr:hypothetical protein [Bacilli bacterium]
MKIAQSVNAPKENNDVIIEVKISDICISIKSRDKNSLLLKAIKATLKL